jgi:uridine kinase
MADQAMRVVLVGIAGCSGSGKSSLARRIATRLDSPFIALQQDWYFRACQVEQCWETPEALDLERFAATIELLVNAVRGQSCPKLRDLSAPRCSDDSCEACFMTTPTRKKRVGLMLHRPSRGRGYHTTSTSDGNVERVSFIVVEGFLLFVLPALAQLFDVRICLEADAERCCFRRFMRENTMDVVVQSTDPCSSDRQDDEASCRHNLSNEWALVKTSEASIDKLRNLPEYLTTYRDWFFGEVILHYDKYWAAQVENARTAASSLIPADKERGAAEPLVATVSNDADTPHRITELADELTAAILRRFTDLVSAS